MGGRRRGLPCGGNGRCGRNIYRGVACDKVVVIVAAAAVHSRAVDGQRVAGAGNDIADDMVESAAFGTATGQDRRCRESLIAGLQFTECDRDGAGRQSRELCQSGGAGERLAIDFECRAVRGVNRQRTVFVAIMIVERVDVYGVVAVGRVHGRDFATHSNLFVVNWNDACRESGTHGVRLGGQIDYVGRAEIEVEGGTRGRCSVDLEIVLIVELDHHLQLAERCPGGVHGHHRHAGARAVIHHDGRLRIIDRDLSGDVFTGRNLPRAENLAEIDQLYEVDRCGRGQGFYESAVGVL